MATYDLWILGESNISISGGKTLDGITQGDGSHLVGETITLDAPAWEKVEIDDDDAVFADNDGSQRLAGGQTIDGVSYAGGTRVEAEYKLVLEDPATGRTYTVVAFNVNNSNPAYGTVEGLAFIGPPKDWPPVGTPLRVVSASEGPRQNDPNFEYQDHVAPCFTPGTRIATPLGPQPVESLRAGDLVLTQDSGARPIRLALRTHISTARLRVAPQLAPVRIPRGSMGEGLPERDLLVSPQHRMLLRDPLCELLFGETEMLAAASHLPWARPVSPAQLPGGVEYVHLLLERHEILFAEGAPTESLLLAPMICDRAPPGILHQLRAAIPDLGQPGGTGWQRAARPLLTQRDVAVLTGTALPRGAARRLSA
ncbi:Hint domain-containing protein [Meinhardsimonia xiamenensis]|uniref:Hint domain-containing protein n=1 Tax=Meinhardsimonia xiamenensis TaxID=990712 RepID=A0A1G9B9S3_9RHOB|nr:Hint domain-containing protein [Meinhardsimonia xiamenensis]PRX35064.1 Hint domain-containing protein [Meinhardsimonia xiamenensis]SDK36247.1 Hint domain-containing protein [Meinhardsimonia xiamenensis]